jgi:hypothetical protein
MFEGIERLSLTKDWITIILLSSLVLIAVIKFAFSERFIKLFSLSYSEKYFTNYSKSKPLIFNTFHFLFFIIINFNISLLIYYAIKAFEPAKISNDLSFFLQIVLILLLFFIVRYLIGYLLGIVFDLTEEQDRVTLLKISSLAYLSMLFFPLLVLINYSSASLHKILITFSLTIALILFFMRYFAIAKNLTLNFNSFFYLLLYICALEIAPILVIYKMFLD